MATFMERLQKSSRFADGSAPSYLRTHPITYERIAEAQARAYGKPYRQVPDSLDFHLVRALLRSYTGTAKEAVAFFTAALADRKYNNEVAARYGLVASLLRAEDYTRAQGGARDAREDRTAAPDDRRDGRSRADGVRRSRPRHRALRGGAGALSEQDAARLRLSGGAAQGRTRRATPPRSSSRELARFPGNGPLHRIAARTYAELGRKTQQYRHQGEYYAWQGDLRGAVVQLELASKAGDGDFYLTSVVETRLRALRRELSEQQAALAKNG